MIGILKQLFGSAEKSDFKQLVQQGATILDVRTAGEFAGGHIKGAMNIPVQELQKHSLAGVNKNKPVITYCASGMRSATARKILLNRGFGEVYNAGGIGNLQNQLK